MKPAFSTVVCPEWTLSHAVRVGQRIGAIGMELRTEGYGATTAACDPALTSPDKFRSMFDAAGIAPLCLATGIRFDAPIDPPVLGRVFGDTEASVRAGKSAVDLARELDVPFVRVFGFETRGSESRSAFLARVIERLVKVLDHCRNTGVKLLIENGGSFPTATALAELMDIARSPLLMAAYVPAVASAAGESVMSGVNVLGDRMVSVKLHDLKRGRPCAIGSGDLHAGEVIDVLRADGYEGWVVADLDHALLPAPIDSRAPIADKEADLAESIRFMFERAGAPHEGAGSTRPVHAGSR